MITARPITMAQPPAKPWTSRAAIITPMVGESAQATDATLITTTAASSGHAAASLVRDRAADQLTQGHPHEERGQGQLHLRRAGPEVGGDPREGRDVHVRGQRRDRGQEHDGRDDRATHAGVRALDASAPSATSATLVRPAARSSVPNSLGHTEGVELAGREVTRG